MLNRIFKSKNTTPSFIVKGNKFEIETSGLVGIINKEKKFCWAIDVYAKQGQVDKHSVSPKFSFIELEPSTDFEYDKFFIWDKTTAYNSKTENWKGDFYIFDAHYFEASLKFTKQTKNEFNVEIKGKVNLNPETYPTTNFEEFSINQLIPFNGILVEIDDKECAFEIAKNVLDISEMKWIKKDQDKQMNDNWIK
ncbi:hypothetical protein [Marinifilum sp. D714]|uniref:hypothetical protein n=1 Tax=Marinifilum sp. D714 TaxID=2937523 RepID=UPI0027C06BDD|nr:hypothetical protein [Marinifilum sp. D714]MDQ2178081.1 hypothetical protein [Marinifilum sp. D714]